MATDTAARPLAVASRVGLRVALALLVAAAAARGARQFAAHAASRAAPGLAGYERALELDPSQPEFHLEAGLLRRDRIETMDLERANHHIDEAIRLNPYHWRYRFEKGRLLEIDGQTEAAETELLKALAYTPHASPYRWRVANFFVRQGDIEQALEHLTVAVAGSRDLQEPGFALMRSLGVGPARVLEIWPRDPDSSRRLLGWWIEAGTVDPPTSHAVRGLWQRMYESDTPPSFADFVHYLRYLLRQGLLLEARSEWIRATRARGFDAPDFSNESNYVWNGGFELPISRGALDWYVTQKDSAVATVEAVADPAEGDRALRLDFRPRGAGVFRGLTQQVVVEGRGAWAVSVALRAEVDSPMAYELEVLELPSRRPLYRSAEVRPTRAWTRVSGTFDFAAPAAGQLLLLKLGPASRLSGSMAPADQLWLDDFNLTLTD